MRLWHENLIKKLPRQQLLGQHRECCALRGKGWKKPHSTVNYVFKYSPMKLVAYHMMIMREMESRGYKVSPEWQDPAYRGKAIGYVNVTFETKLKVIRLSARGRIYKEHDKAYLEECIDNLKNKNILIGG